MAYIPIAQGIKCLSLVFVTVRLQHLGRARMQSDNDSAQLMRTGLWLGLD